MPIQASWRPRPRRALGAAAVAAARPSRAHRPHRLQRPLQPHRPLRGLGAFLALAALAAGCRPDSAPAASRRAPPVAAAAPVAVPPAPPAPAPAAKVAPGPAAPVAPTPVHWRRHVGTQARAFGALGSVRGVGRGLTGRSPSTPDGAAGFPAELLGAVREAGEGGRDVVLPVGGLDSARDPDAAREFLAGAGGEAARAWREAVGRNARALETLSGTTVAWQMGNEINSAHWSRSLLGREAPDDPGVLPIYVERYLRPAAEAIREADGQGGARQLVVLGSVANARRAGTRAWLDALLARPLAGDAASRTVADVVDVASIHYLVTADDDGWEEHLDSIFDRWVRSGRLAGLWATEELGTRRAGGGLGAATTLKVLGRYLTWWSRRGVTPLESRCFLYGWQRGRSGTRGLDALALLDEVVGDAALIALGGAQAVEAPVRVELHAFEVAGRPGVRLAILVWPEGAPPGTVVRVRTGVPATAASATHFLPSGSVRPPAVVEEGVVVLRVGALTPAGSASLVVIESEPASHGEPGGTAAASGR